MLTKQIKLILSTLGLFFIFAITANAQSVDDLFHHAGDPVIGNPKGKITIVEFFDYQCSYCVDMATVLDGIVESNPNVRVVYKELPIRGPMSVVASRAALAANKQGKYHKFSRALLFGEQSLSPRFIYLSAKKLGVDLPQLKKDMTSDNIKNVLMNNINLARNLNVNGTPAFFIGKTNAKSMNDLDYVPGIMSESQLQAAINRLS